MYYSSTSEFLLNAHGVVSDFVLCARLCFADVYSKYGDREGTMAARPHARVFGVHVAGLRGLCILRSSYWSSELA